MAIAGFLAVTENSNSHPFTFELPSEKQVTAAETTDYIIAVTNSSKRDIRVVGLTWC